MTNALAPYASLASLMKGRSLDEEIQSLVGRYGADAVRDATKRLAKKRIGRKAERDWLILRPYIEQDAVDWLDGKDPLSNRTNYALAKMVIDHNKGHDPISTQRRVMRKLSARRMSFMLISAWYCCDKDRPAKDYFRVESAMLACDPLWAESVTRGADLKRGFIQRYTEAIGDPDLEKSFPELEAELQNASRPIPPPNALAGLLSQYSQYK